MPLGIVEAVRNRLGDIRNTGGAVTGALGDWFAREAGTLGGDVSALRRGQIRTTLFPTGGEQPNYVPITPGNVLGVVRQGLSGNDAIRNAVQNIEQNPAIQSVGMVTGGEDIAAPNLVRDIGTIGKQAARSAKTSASLFGNLPEQAAQALPPLVSNAEDVLNYARTTVAQDKPTAVGNLLDRIPGVNYLRRIGRPGLGMTDEALTANVAGDVARNQVLQTAHPQEVLTIRNLADAFGQDAVHGAPTAVRFIGPEEAAVKTLATGEKVVYPGLNTLEDIAARPQLYDLTDAQKAALQTANAAHQSITDMANALGAGITHTAVAPGGLHLPHVDASVMAQTVQEAKQVGDAAAMRSGRLAGRVFDNGFDRWANDITKLNAGELKDMGQVYNPELDIVRLIHGLNSTKADAAAYSNFVSGLGAKTKDEVMAEIDPRLVVQRGEAETIVNSLSSKMKTAEAAAKKFGYTETKLQAEENKILGRLKMLAQDHAMQEDNGVSGPILNKIELQAKELEMRAASMEKVIGATRTNKLLKTSAAGNFKQQLDEAKSMLSDLRYAYTNANPRDYVFSKEVYRYLPSAVAKDVKKLLEVHNSVVLRVLGNINATVLSGDLSPIIGQQGQIAWLTAPVQTSVSVAKSVVKGTLAGHPMQAFDPAYLAQKIAEDPNSWNAFAVSTGRSVRMGTPEEVAGGWLGAIPKVGGKWSEYNRNIYTATIQAQKEAWDGLLKYAMEHGASYSEAAAAAGDTVTKLIPQATPARMGQSQARQQALRAPFTSITFIMKPVALLEEATVGALKFGTGQNVSTRERLAMDVMRKFWGTTLGLSATSAAIRAQAEGQSPDNVVKAALEAISPVTTSGKLNPRFAALNLPAPGISGGWVTLPLGGPFRAIIRAAAPAKVATAGGKDVWLPFAGIPQYLSGRIQPALRNVYEQVQNKDYYGKAIRTGDFPLNILQGFVYAAQATLPLTASQPYQAMKQGLSPAEAAYSSAAQFFGTNVGLPTISSLRDDLSKVKFGIPYDQLNGLQRQVINKDPAVQHKIASMPPYLNSVESQKITAERVAGEQADMKALQAGQISPKQFADQMKQRMRDAAMKSDEMKALLSSGKPLDNPLDKALTEWYGLYKKAEITPNGPIDWNRYDDLLSQFNATHTSEQLNYIDNRTRTGHAPEVQWFFDARKQIENTGYWDTIDKAFARFQFSAERYGASNINELISAYNQAVQEGNRSKAVQIDNLVNKIQAISGRERQIMRRRDPSLDRALFMTGSVSRPAVRGRNLT